MADEVTVPTQEEIAALPRWAKVAFAARCARRVLPLYKHNWPDAPKKHIEAVRIAVEVAEYSAATAYVAPHAYASARAAAGSAQADTRATAAAAYASTAYAAAEAADAAAYAPADSARAAADSAHMAAVSMAATQDIQWVSLVIRRDFEFILDESRRQKWADDTPVPPWVFGPMWPNGVPNGWPEGDPNERLVLRLEAPAGATPEQIDEMKAKLLGGVEKVTAAAGMTPEQFRHFVTVEVLQPAGVGNG